MAENRKLKSMCAGCRNDFYNGNNDLGVKECWSFRNAEVVKRQKVPVHLPPPWRMKAQKVLSCKRQAGYVYVEAV